MRRLILHIGPHKTGTTSFQRALEINEPELRARGVGVVSEPQVWAGARTGRRRAALHGAADLFTRPGLPTGGRVNGLALPLGPAQKSRHRKRLAQRVADMVEPLALMSAESFWYLRTAQERDWIGDFVAASGRVPTILFANREPVSWSESWQRHLRAGAGHFRRMQALPADQCLDAPWYFDLQAVRRFWAP